MSIFGNCTASIRRRRWTRRCRRSTPRSCRAGPATSGSRTTPAGRRRRPRAGRRFPGRVPLASTQVEYSLLERGIEREVVPAALDAGMSLLAWSPLGRGVLTGKYRTGIPADSRAASDHLASFVEPYLDEARAGIVQATCTAAEGLGVSPLAVALGWVRDRPGVASAIVGARTTAQLLGVLAEADVVLPEEIRHRTRRRVGAGDRLPRSRRRARLGRPARCWLRVLPTRDRRLLGVARRLVVSPSTGPNGVTSS